MDIAEILNSANTAFEQIKKMSAVTDDVNAIMGSVTGFASQIGDLKRAMIVEEVRQLHVAYSNKKSKKTPTERTLEIYTAKTRIVQMEKELYHMFLYGDLHHLGMDGYKEFCKIREDIEKKSSKKALEDNTWEIQQQEDERFIKQMKVVIGALFGSIVAVVQLAQQIKDFLQ